MRRWFQAALVLCSLALVPAAAHAGWILEGSVGKGATVSPSPVTATQTNLMLAPGVGLLSDILRLQVGFVGDLPDLKNSKFDLQFRPMLTVAPPILPIYGRAIFAVANVFHNNGPKTLIAYGAAAGLKFGLGPVGVFVEAGFLPRSIASRINWVIEGRAGVALFF
jgi:uncharacterized membrane protein YqaE (UPF0057 family)